MTETALTTTHGGQVLGVGGSRGATYQMLCL